jgi:cell division protein FtsB
MKVKRTAPVRGADEPRRTSRNTARRPADAPPRRRKPTREQRPQRSAPATNPIPRPTGGPARPKNTSQAKARAKARKAKAPKVVRPPLRERIIVKLASIELSPRALVARVPFVVLVIGSLGVGLGVTLWLSTDAAERSYQLSHARETNQALLQQKEALERQVLEAQAAPALAEAARNLGMIPSRDTAHLVQDPSGNWVVVGTPNPAQGIAPPPLNTPLPEETPPAPAPPPAPRVVEPREVTIRVPPRAPLAVPPGAEVPHAVTGQTPALGPAVAPAPPAEVPAAPAAPPADAPVVPLDGGPPPAAPPVAAPLPAAPA